MQSGFEDNTSEKTNGKINYLENIRLKDLGFWVFFFSKQKRAGTELGSMIRVQTRFWWEESRGKGNLICNRNQQVSCGGVFWIKEETAVRQNTWEILVESFCKFDKSPKTLCLGTSQQKKTWQGMRWQPLQPYPSFNKWMINMIFHKAHKQKNYCYTPNKMAQFPQGLRNRVFIPNQVQKQSLKSHIQKGKCHSLCAWYVASISTFYAS